MSSTTVTVRGLETFEGELVRISAGWPLPDLAGCRVGVLGDPVALVDVVPRLVGVPDLVKVFLSAPVWVLPASDLEDSHGDDRGAVWRVPAVGAALAAVRRRRRTTDIPRSADSVTSACQRFLHREVDDAWIRRQLTPGRHRGAVPVVRADGFYSALHAAGCELITWPVARISARGVRTGDGIEHRVDTLVVVDEARPLD